MQVMAHLELICVAVRIVSITRLHRVVQLELLRSGAVRERLPIQWQRRRRFAALSTLGDIAPLAVPR